MTTQDLRSSIGELFRRQGAQGVLRGASIARHMNLSPSDLECLDLLFLDGPLTPGAIQKGTGLSSGAVTAMLDRLSVRGLVIRERDPKDGRRVNIRIDADNIVPIQDIYREADAHWEYVFDQFGDDELNVIERFLQLVVAAMIDLNRSADMAERVAAG